MSTSFSDHLYFTRLELENVKSFGEPQYVDFTIDGQRPARWTLILGENNVGKTTILECLTRMRPDVANRFEGDPTGQRGFLPELAAEEDNAYLDRLVRNGSDVDTRITLRMVGGLTLDGQGGRPNPIACDATIQRRDGRFYAANWDGTMKKSFSQPVVFAYGAGRHVRPAGGDDAIPDPVASLFDPAVELIDAEGVLQRLDYHVAKFKQRSSRLRLKALTTMLAEILPEVEKASDIGINPPATSGLGDMPYGVRVKTPHGEVPLGQLSLGYQTVTAWTVDIAWRLFNQYPASNHPMREPAIVVVDEIDLHLHPRWQRELRAKLTSHFPNVQFVATAHSPLMAQDYLEQNLVLLQMDEAEGQVEISNEPSVVKDWSVDQLLTSELFGLPSARSRDTSDAVRRRLELLDKAQLTQDEEHELIGLETRVSALAAGWNEDDEVTKRVVARTMSIVRTDRKA